MPLRTLLRYLLNNEQIIQKLADSYPIKRAAQLTAFLAHRGKQLGEEGLDQLQKSDPVKKLQDSASETSQKINTFKDTFMKEIQDGMKEVKDNVKDKQNKER